MDDKNEQKKNFLIVIIFRNESHDSSIFIKFNAIWGLLKLQYNS